MKGRDIIGINDLNKDEINSILKLAKEFEDSPEKYTKLMNSKIMVPLFFEPSTRTQGSFAMAMSKIGGSVFDFDVEASSQKKGETLSDTARMINGYHPDIVVIRHKKDGSARLVADIIDCPVINGGDGKHEHPTQTLLDLYTIKELRKKQEKDINNTKIALVGDLKYGRTVHSLVKALNLYDAKFMFFSPKELKMPSYTKNSIPAKNFLGEFDLKQSDLERAVSECDIVYMTRIQRERFSSDLEGESLYLKITKDYKLDQNLLKKCLPKKRQIIMHPLPRVNEISRDVDDSDYDFYFKQAENGLYIRQALIKSVTGK